jgi:hypothetical protein
MRPRRPAYHAFEDAEVGHRVRVVRLRLDRQIEDAVGAHPPEHCRMLAIGHIALCTSPDFARTEAADGL